MGAVCGNKKGKRSTKKLGAAEPTPYTSHMNIPRELVPSDVEAIRLLDGREVMLPVCRTIFPLWDGPKTFTYGHKPMLKHNGKECFAELLILNLLIEHGWDGVWVETYGGVHYLRTMPTEWNLKSQSVPIPANKEALLLKIRKAAGTKSCFDVFAWRGDQVLFYEAKRAGKDRVRDTQKRFIAGALAWNFVTDIGQILENLKDKRLEVLVIPPDLLDKLSSKATYEKLKKEGKIRFSSLQYLTIKAPTVTPSGDEDEIEVALDNYMLLSPDSLPLDDANKEKLQEVIANAPLDLIEYWSIDPDYDGEIFRSVWQDYRGNTENDADPLRVVHTAKIRVPKKNGKRKICVKAVDVFGWESEVVKEI